MGAAAFALLADARRAGDAPTASRRLCVELHGNQLVYNVPSLLRLRAPIGPVVGANLDPSHLMWMGADPIAAIDALGDAILHVHAKDTFLNKPRQATTSLLENGPQADVPRALLEVHHARLRPRRKLVAGFLLPAAHGRL